jgi:hypothetical protein
MTTITIASKDKPELITRVADMTGQGVQAMVGPEHWAKSCRAHCDTAHVHVPEYAFNRVSIRGHRLTVVLTNLRPYLLYDYSKVLDILSTSGPPRRRGKISMSELGWVIPERLKPLCSVIDCDRVSKTRGMCSKHYQAWLRRQS